MSGAQIAQLYRAVLRRAWPAALLYALLMSYFLDRLTLSLPDLLAPDAVERYSEFIVSASLWRSVLAVTLLSLWPTSALVVCALRLSGGQSPPLAGGLLAALRAYPAVLALSLVYLALTALGLMLFVVPGIYLAGVLQLWVVALLSGEASVGSALQSSWRRVGHHWWRSNSMVAIVVLCGLGVGALVSLGADLLVHVVAALWAPNAAVQRLTALAVSVLGNFVTVPAYPVALVASYRDLARPVAPQP
jgi:hypothetical protein